MSDADTNFESMATWHRTAAAALLDESSLRDFHLAAAKLCEKAADIRAETIRECAQIADDAREDAEGDVRVVRDRIRYLR